MGCAKHYSTSTVVTILMHRMNEARLIELIQFMMSVIPRHPKPPQRSDAGP